MNKQKILHVTFDMEMGGAEQVIRQLIENSDVERFQSSVLCLDSKVGVLGKELDKQGFDTFCFSRQSGLDTVLIKRLKTYIRKNKIDVLHCHQYTPYVYGLLASLGTSANVVFTEHGRFYPDTYRWKRYLVNPILSFFTDSVVCISKATAKALSKYENFPYKKTQVIYNGVKSGHQLVEQQEKLTIKNDLGLTEQDLIFGTISRLDPIKNQLMMISAFSQVMKVRADSKLLLIGDGPMRAELEQHAQKLGVSDSVIFTGFIVNPQRYFCLMDIFLLPSLSEGTSMTLLEAMAFSIPCIVTDVGGNPEIVLHQDTGLVTPNNDEEALAKAMLHLASDDELYHKFARNGRARYLENFTVEEMVGAYQAMYLQFSKN